MEQDNTYPQSAQNAPSETAGAPAAEEGVVEQALAQAEQALERRQEQWDKECEATQGVYPDFDFAKEASDPVFLAMLEGGVPVRTAYEALHLDQVKAAAVKEAETRLVGHILARGTRPRENGAAAQSAVTTRTDVSRLTREQRADIARRAMRGERDITLR